ncbi:hypothetical protein SAMN05421833_1641, partial [Microbispora rosea]
MTLSWWRIGSAWTATKPVSCAAAAKR